MQKLSRSLLLASLAIAIACSGKSPDTSKGSSTSTPKPAPTVSSNDTALFNKVCSQYFDLLKSTMQDQMEGSQKDFTKSLQASVDEMVDDYSKMGFESTDLTKDGQCGALAKLTTDVQKSKIPQVYDQFRKTRSWLKDKKDFNSLGFTMENLFSYFMNHLDHFSFFNGYYTDFFSDVGQYDWQIQFLNRSDYLQLELSGDDKSKNRKPQYLYVEYTPAYLSKSLPIHTKIYKINDVVVAEHSYKEATDEVSRSSTLKLSVSIPDPTGKYTDPTNLTLTYSETKSHPIIFQILEQAPYKIGYLKIPEFENPDDAVDLLRALDAKNNPKLDGVILDLRNNFGGSLDVGAAVLDSFFQQDATYAYIMKNDKSEAAKINDPFSPIDYGRVIVLTDFQTISTAEIVTAALKDYSAALVVGEPTFGKGIGQSYRKISGDLIEGGLAITNLYVFSPKGNTWYLQGIQPDINLYEPADQNIQKRLKDLPDGSYPKAYAEKTIDADFDPSVKIVPQRVTDDIRQQLNTFYTSASDDDKKCSTLDLTQEESSCMLNWSIKILKKWIELTPAPVKK